MSITPQLPKESSQTCLIHYLYLDILVRDRVLLDGLICAALNVVMESLTEAISDYVSRTRPATSAWRGGRGRLGPLKHFLREHRAIIQDARSGPQRLTWDDVAALATTRGICRADGSAYDAAATRRAWATLRLSGQPEQASSTVLTVQAGGQAVPPATKAAPSEAATRPSTSDMMPLKKFGGQR